MDMPERRKRIRISLAAGIVIVLGFSIVSCKTTEPIRPESADPVEETQTVTLPQPTPTLDPVEAKYRSREPSGPTPTPVPLEVWGYGVEPTDVLYRAPEGTDAQLIVFFSTVIYDPLPERPVVLMYQGRPARQIVEKGVGLFEAQDLVFNFQIGPDTPTGFYDARVELHGITRLLKNVFEVR